MVAQIDPTSLMYTIAFLATAFAAVVIGAILGGTLARLPPKTRKVAVVMVRNPLELELKTRVVETPRGDLIVKDGKDLLVYKIPEGVKPAELVIGKRRFKIYMVDSRRELFYQVPEEPPETQGDAAKLHPAMVDPKTLADYIAGKSIEKLLKPMRTSPTEAVLYMAVGGLMVALAVFFVLPLLGYQVSIGGGGVFG